MAFLYHSITLRKVNRRIPQKSYFYIVQGHGKFAADRCCTAGLLCPRQCLQQDRRIRPGHRPLARVGFLRGRACFRGCADCVEGAREKGVIYGMGAYEKGEIKGSPAMSEAYEMGKKV